MSLICMYTKKKLVLEILFKDQWYNYDVRCTTKSNLICLSDLPGYFITILT